MPPEAPTTETTELAVTTQNTELATTTQETAAPPATTESSVTTESPNPGDGALATTTTEVYAPNYKFKVMDKEHEVPDFLRPFIKDKNTEKQLIDILQKAEGLPIAKERLRSERDEARNNFAAISNQVRKASATYQRGDIDGFFDMLKIPHERILQWAADKVTYSQLPAEQRQVHDQSLQAQRRAAQLEEQNQLYAQQMQEQVSQAKQRELDFELARPEVKALATQYDEMVGKPGAFAAEVVNRGQMAWHQRQEDISAAQAVQEILQVYGKFLKPVATPATTATTTANPPSGPAAQQPKVTIPNVQGNKSSSPVRKGVKSVEELRKIANDMATASS